MAGEFEADSITQRYLHRWPDSKRVKSWAGRMVHIQTENGVWRTNGHGYTWADKPDAWVLPFEEAQKCVAHCGPEKQASFIAARPAPAIASEDLLKKAVAAFNALSPEQQAEMMDKQRQSWVRGNVGLSRDEAAQWHEAEAERKRSVAIKSKRLEAQIATHETSAAYFRSLTRPAPAATDPGLVTVTYRGKFKADGPLQWEYYPTPDSGFDPDKYEEQALCFRSQADELLAAERVEKEAFAKEIKEAAYEAWPEADDVGSDAPDIIRQLGQERAEFLAEVEELKNKLYRAEVDNAAKDALAQWMVRLGSDGVKCLPIYERLERELETLSSTESKMAEIFARAKRLKHQTAVQSSAVQYAATRENRPPHN